MSTEHVMTKPEFAERLGVSVSTIEKLMRAGKLRPVKIGTRVLFREHHVTEVLDLFDQSKRKPVLKG